MEAKIKGDKGVSSPPPVDDDVSIYQVSDLSDLELVSLLSREIWGEGASVSGPEMAVHLSYGGLIIIAKRGDRPVGFSYAFPVVVKKETILWSHETACLERDSGLGFAMKLLQKRIAKDMGYSAIMWSYDPFVARNGYFNLVKLKAVVVSYKVNAYGKIEGDLQNPNLPTDRFIVRLDLDREGADWECQGLKEVVLSDMDGSPVVVQMPIGLEGPCAVAIPTSPWEEVRLDSDLAMAWIMAFRTVASDLFARGMVAVAPWTKGDHRIGGYLFCNPSKEEAGK